MSGPKRNLPAGTRQLQAAALLGRQNMEDWVRWAADAIVEGYDAPNLRILAGLEPPFDDLEINRLLKRISLELGIHALREENCVSYYTSAILLNWKAGRIGQKSVLADLKNLCLERNYDRQLMDFANLYWASTDLETEVIQWYWSKADRKNISKIVNDYFLDWLENHKENVMDQ